MLRRFRFFCARGSPRYATTTSSTRRDINTAIHFLCSALHPRPLTPLLHSCKLLAGWLTCAPSLGYSPSAFCNASIPSPKLVCRKAAPWDPARSPATLLIWRTCGRPGPGPGCSLLKWGHQIRQAPRDVCSVGGRKLIVMQMKTR